MQGYTPGLEPKGATPHERRVCQQLHRLADTTDDRTVRHVAGEGLALLVELIEGRGKREGFLEAYYRPHDEG